MNDSLEKIDRNAKNVSIPATTKQINPLAYFHGVITLLSLENSQIKIIDESSFSHCFSLVEISLPSCLEEIRANAFNSCTKIKQIQIPSDSLLWKIGDRAFRHCYSIENIKFPHLLEIIGQSSFEHCKKLKVIDLRYTKVRNIGVNAFKFCRNSFIYLPSSITTASIVNLSDNLFSIDENHPLTKIDYNGSILSNSIIFHCNKRLKHFLIRRGVEKITKNCFIGSNLVSITIPASVIEIGNNAFYNNQQLIRINFSKNSRLNEIGTGAFSYCSSIKKIRFPRALKIIRSYAFSDCSKLNQVYFPYDSQLETIENAFQNTSIKTLSLPPSIKEIKDVCSKMLDLESIYVDNEMYKSSYNGDAIYSKDGSELICIIKNTKTFQIPSNVRIIKHRTFCYSFIAGEILIPKSVEEIEDEAFLYCMNLKSINFCSGSNLKSLGLNSFPKLEDLSIKNKHFINDKKAAIISINPRGIVFTNKLMTSFELDSNIEVIYSNAFKDSTITSIKFPKSIKKICKCVFNRSNLKRVDFAEGSELDLIDDEAFFDCFIQRIKLPLIKEKLGNALGKHLKVIEFPPNFRPNSLSSYLLLNCMDLQKVICPKSSFSSLARLNFQNDLEIEIIEVL